MCGILTSLHRKSVLKSLIPECIWPSLEQIGLEPYQAVFVGHDPDELNGAKEYWNGHNRFQFRPSELLQIIQLSDSRTY